MCDLVQGGGCTVVGVAEAELEKNKVCELDVLLADGGTEPSSLVVGATPSVFSKSNNWPMKLKFGETFFLRCLTKS